MPNPGTNGGASFRPGLAARLGCVVLTCALAGTATAKDYPSP